MYFSVKTACQVLSLCLLTLVPACAKLHRGSGKQDAAEVRSGRAKDPAGSAVLPVLPRERVPGARSPTASLSRQEQVDPVAAYSQDRLAKKLVTAHRRWLRERDKAGADPSVVIGLGWSKGLSSRFSPARGVARLDLARRSIALEVRDAGDLTDVWLIDNQPGPLRSVMPEPGDTVLRLGTLRKSAGGAELRTEIGEALDGVDIDLIAITSSGEDPLTSGVLFGAPNLFERMLLGARSRSLLRAEGRPVSSQGPGNSAASPAVERLESLASRGARIFFQETFQGNGRTCGTCHPAENNFTIDPEFIATLPPGNPLFVAEFVPELAANFEKPELMRKAGLILENLDGFDDLEKRFVMRGVPHTLALGTSLLPAPDQADQATVPPQERVGWSGDGSPGAGTLREFAVGAVRQHFTRTLNRNPGVDFRFPTDEELDALEAFMLSLGRDEDVDLGALKLKGEVPSRGKAIFLASDSENGKVAAGKCNTCHANAGASVSFQPGGFNFNFDTGVEELPDQIADLIDSKNNPPDGGFGREPDMLGALGNGTFNTPSLIEAADTGPFFHNNSIATLEEAVGFYNSAAFNNSPAGQFLASRDSGGIGIRLEATQVAAVAALLRVLNALENIRSATELATLADDPGESPIACFMTAAEEARDAAEVLQRGGLHPEAANRLEEAGGFLELASGIRSAPVRRAILTQALDSLRSARAELVED